MLNIAICLVLSAILCIFEYRKGKIYNTYPIGTKINNITNISKITIMYEQTYFKYERFYKSGANSINESNSDTVSTIKRLGLSNVASRQELPAYIANLVPKSNVKFWSLPEDDKREYLLKRQEVKRLKDIKAFNVELFAAIRETRKIESITITVEWKRSSVWGSNPRAKAYVYFEDGGFIETFESDSIGGSGFDRVSVAIAQVLGKINALTRDLLEVNESSGGFLPFTGHVLPRFIGGASVTSFGKPFEEIGYKFRHIVKGSNFEVYEVVKK